MRASRAAARPPQSVDGRSLNPSSRHMAGCRAPVTFNSSRLVSQSAVQPEARAEAAVPTTVATPVAPASDLQTRQLRLLPWQTSADSSSSNAGAASSKASSGSQSGDEGVSARRASGAAASTSAKSASGSCSGGSRRLRQRASSVSSGSSSAAADMQSGMPAAAAGIERVAAARAGTTCEACGGRGVLVSASGVQSCFSCQQWRQRPDYRPGGPLLTLQDVDLSALDASSGSSGAPDGSSGAGSQAGSVSSMDEDVSGSRKPRRKSGPMSEERRKAISRALQSKGAKSEEHKRSISRAMREAHARNPQLRHAPAGQKKRCGHCGKEGHNRKTCPELLATAAAAAAAEAGVAAEAGDGRKQGQRQQRQRGQQQLANLVIVIEEVDEISEVEDDSPAAAAAAAPEAAVAAAGSAAAATGEAAPVAATAALADGSLSLESSIDAQALPADALGSSSTAGSIIGSVDVDPPAPLPASYLGGDLLPTRRLGPGLALSPEGSWVFPLPRTKEECVAQAAQAVLRAWDDGMRRLGVELLLPQADADEEGTWPGGIRQQFRVAKPMVESLLLRLKEHTGLEGRITAELLDEGDCVAAWQSERLGAVLFATADTLPALRRIDDALSGKRLTLVINPQWQTQGQVISDFGIGRSRKNAERFVAAFDEAYYLRRVRVFGDDVRIMRCYPGQWQVHYVPPDPRADTVLLSCDDGKPTFERLIQLLKQVPGSRASKSWLDRFLTPPPASNPFGEFAGGTAEEEAAAAAAAATGSQPGAAAPGNAGPEQDSAIAGATAAAAASSDSSSGKAPLRDIVTGELLPPGAAAAVDKVGGKLVRDIRLEPVQHIARWLGSTPARPSERQRGEGSGE